MPLPQQKFREVVFQMLYSHDLSQHQGEEVGDLLMNELAITRRSVRQAAMRVAKVWVVLPELDSHISRTSHAYAFDRIQAIERNILRLGVYELLMDEQIPPKVAISEAMRLSKKFGTPESVLFVNAILDAIYKESRGEGVDLHAISQAAEAFSAGEQLAELASQEYPLTTDKESDDE